MQLKSGVAMIGGAVGVALGIVPFALGLAKVYPTLIALAIVGGLQIVGYIVAAATASGSKTDSGAFFRGLLVGLNSGSGAMILWWLLPLVVPLPAGLGLAIGTALGLLGFLSVFAPISQNEGYQGLIGYLSWAMPGSWLVFGLGLVLMLVSLLLGIIGIWVPFLRLVDVDCDGPSGTLFLKGGLIGNLNYAKTAFDMGNFGFVHESSATWHKKHEAGHNLSLAVFGSVVHLLGALEENALGRNANALTERIAESNSAGDTGDTIPVWA